MVTCIFKPFSSLLHRFKESFLLNVKCGQRIFQSNDRFQIDFKKSSQVSVYVHLKLLGLRLLDPSNKRRLDLIILQLLLSGLLAHFNLGVKTTCPLIQHKLLYLGYVFVSWLYQVGLSSVFVDFC